jgi:hypothetical protein
MDKKIELLNRRKYLMINPRFQLSFMGYTIGMAAVIIAVFYFSNLYFFWRFANKGHQIGLEPDHIFFKFLKEQQQTMDLIFLVTALFAFIFLIVYGYYLSHRVAGALRRFESHLYEISDSGESKELKFRKSDYFQELPAAFNAYLKSKGRVK